MPLFKKKEVKKPEQPKAKMVGIEIEVRQLVTIEKHESRVDGKVQEPQYRISIADRDVITVSQREYDEVFMEMLRLKNDCELIHDIAEAHMQKHGHIEIKGNPLAALDEIIKKAVEASEK